MKILGISAFYHDSAAALVIDGKVVTALEEERFTRVKHDNAWPAQAISKCLLLNKIKIQDLDCVAYYEKPLLKFERILDTFIKTYPRSLRPFVQTVPEYLTHKLKIEQTIRKLGYRGQIKFVSHHLSHASAAYFSSNFTQTAILTVDGVGEYQTTALWQAKDKQLELLAELNFPHSLGLFYSTLTAFLGFRVNNDEYKVMGLSAYGKPRYVNKLKKLINLKPDGSFALNMKYFAFEYSGSMWSQDLEKLLGRPRQPKDKILAKHRDLASSLQTLTEQVYFQMLRHLHSLTKTENLCLSGGVALNALANGKIYNETPFKRVHILGPSGDSGTAIGAALYSYYQQKPQAKRQPITHLYLGTQTNDSVIGKLLDKNGLKYQRFHSQKELIRTTAQLLADNKIVGWWQGKMEFGPRALGHRSILANPKQKNMKDKVNIIKRREFYRPFAASVLQEHVHELFAVPEKNYSSPFMNFCFQIKPSARKLITSIVHTDNSCRIQTVNRHDNGVYYDLIREFYRLTGIPAVLNTSFNLSHEPIVEHAELAIEDFVNTKMDALVIEKWLIKKD